MPQQLLPAPIRDQLASARRKLRAVDGALGLARAVLFLAAALVLLFTLDTSLQPPVPVLRSFALFVAMVAGAGATVFLARPLRRRLSDDDVALLVEGEYPELNGGLVSSVQLARDLDRPDLYTSRALIQATIDRTADRVGALDFGAVVRTGPLVPLWLLIAACLGLGAALLSVPTVAEYAGVFYQRVALGERIGYPKLIRLRVDMPPVIQVAKGDDLSVRAFVDGLKVDRLSILTRFASGGATERREMVQITRALPGGDQAAARRVEEAFEKTYQNVTEPFTFLVESSEHGVQSEVFAVEVVTRPRVEAFEFVLRYPEYIGKAPEAVQQPDLRVPAGTSIGYVVVASKPLERATLQLMDEGAAAREAVRRGGEPQLREGPAPTLRAALADAELAPGGRLHYLAASLERLSAEGVTPDRLLLGELRVTADVSFQFALRSTEGLESGKRPVRFMVQVVEDRRPVVSIPVPGRRKQVTPQARVPLEVAARDDYGLADVVLRFGVQRAADAQEPGAAGYQQVPLGGLEIGAREARLQHVVDVADFRLQPGDRLHYHAVAFDQNVDEQARSKQSRAYELAVVRPEDLERILQDRLTALKERLKALARDQGSAREASEAFVAALAPKDLLTEDDRRVLQRLGQDQQRITRRLVDVKQELEELAAEREQNRLTEEASMALLAELAGGVRDLGERASPLVVRELEDGRATPSLTPALRTRLARVPDLQRDIEQAILALATRIDKWGDFTEVLQEVRDLLRGEERIMEGTRRAAQSEHR